MNALIYRSHSHPSALQRPEPIADAFALRCHDAVSRQKNHQIMWGIRFGTRHPSQVVLGLIDLLAQTYSSATLQIPIAT